MKISWQQLFRWAVVLWIGLLPSSRPFSGPAGAGSDIGETPRQENRIEHIVERVLPSIAHIVAEKKIRDEFSDQTISRKSGTGFLIDTEGHVLTNYHVVDGANRILVSLPGAPRRIGRLVGTDPMLDVALLKISSVPEEIVPAVFSKRNKILLGEEIIVVGNPFALHNSVTKGVVSGLKRPISSVEQEIFMELFQFDAALNPGNSGGPVLDRAGEVIGIATAMYPNAEGIGFAVPTQEIRRILPDLKAVGHARRLWLGVMGFVIDEDIARLFDLPRETGFLVESVHRGSPADRAGFRGGSRIIPFAGKLFQLGGDIILTIDGQPVNDAFDLVDTLKDCSDGDVITVGFLRDGNQETTRIRLEIRPDPLIAIPAEAHP